MNTQHRELANMIAKRQDDCEQTPSQVLCMILKEGGIVDPASEIFKGVMIIFEKDFFRCEECGWIYANYKCEEDRVCDNCHFELWEGREDEEE